MITTALILAGGFGTRLQAVVSNLPKPMAPVNGEPFLNYQLRYLKHFGIKKIILSVGYLHNVILSYYGHHFEGMDMQYAIEEQPLGTGGGIRLALQNTSEKQVFVLNGDSFFDADLAAFYQKHTSSAANFSLALRRVENASRYGQVITNPFHTIVSFKEKSEHKEAGTINAGIYILQRELFLSNTPEGTGFSIEKDFFEKKAKELTIKGFEFKGHFIDIGIPEDYTKAQDEFKEFKYR